MAENNSGKYIFGTVKVGKKVRLSYIKRQGRFSI